MQRLRLCLLYYYVVIFVDLRFDLRSLVHKLISTGESLGSLDGGEGGAYIAVRGSVIVLPGIPI